MPILAKNDTFTGEIYGLTFFYTLTQGVAVNMGERHISSLKARCLLILICILAKNGTFSCEIYDYLY